MKHKRGKKEMKPGQRCTRFKRPDHKDHRYDDAVATYWTNAAFPEDRCPYVEHRA